MFNKKKEQSKPAAQSTKIPFDAQVFSMPERYRHGAEAPLKEPEPRTPKPVQQVAPAPPPKAPPKPKPILKKKKRGSTRTLVFIGVMVLLMLGAGGYFLLRSVQPTSIVEAPEPQEPVTRPAPVAEEPEEPEAPEEPEEPKEPINPFSVEIVRGTDSDSDGLTDVEEDLVYGTNPLQPDSDQDGFLDGNEVFHRYDPNGGPVAGNTLFESGIVARYEGETTTNVYHLFYPIQWQVSEVDNEVVIDAGTGEGIRVRFEQKPSTLAVDDWVDQEIGLDSVVEGTTKNDLVMVQSQNTLFAYLDLGTSVLILEYDTGTKARVDYLQTFKMMLNSVEIVDEIQEVQPNGAGSSSVGEAEEEETTDEPGV